MCRRGDPQRRQQWQAAVWQWQKSGQSVRDYCRAQGLKDSAFYFWRRKLAGHDSTSAAGHGANEQRLASQAIGGAGLSVPRGLSHTRKPRASFLPVRVVKDGQQATTGVEIALAGGRTVRVQPGFDRQALADVLHVLEGVSC